MDRRRRTALGALLLAVSLLALSACDARIELQHGLCEGQINVLMNKRDDADDDFVIRTLPAREYIAADHLDDCICAHISPAIHETEPYVFLARQVVVSQTQLLLDNNPLSIVAVTHPRVPDYATDADDWPRETLTRLTSGAVVCGQDSALSHGEHQIEIVFAETSGVAQRYAWEFTLLPARRPCREQLDLALLENKFLRTEFAERVVPVGQHVHTSQMDNCICARLSPGKNEIEPYDHLDQYAVLERTRLFLDGEPLDVVEVTDRLTTDYEIMYESGGPGWPEGARAYVSGAFGVCWHTETLGPGIHRANLTFTTTSGKVRSYPWEFRIR